MGFRAHLDESGSESDSNDSSDGSSQSSSASGSDSGSGNASSGSESDHDHNDKERDSPPEDKSKSPQNASDSQDGSSSGGSSKQMRLLHLKEMWEEMPELYGVRRSTRERKEVARFAPRGSGDEEKSRKKGSRRSRRSTDSWHGRSSNDDDDDDNSSDSGSSSDGFKPVRRNIRRPTGKPSRWNRQKKKPVGRSRRRQQDSDDDTDSDDDRHVRSTNRGGRQASKKVSYKEDSVGETDSSDLIEVDAKAEDVNDAETIEKVFHHRRGRKGATGSKTAMYNCQDHGDPNDGWDPQQEETELQYFIKWKNWSHIHNTWENEESLVAQKVNGLKKLENYKKRDEEIREFKKSATPEDLEYFECQQENFEILIEEHMLVDRICTHTANKTENNIFPDYLIKWQGLPYSECTWEDGELVAKKFKDAIDDYNQRNKSQKIPSKYMKALKHRPKFSPLKKQSSCLGSDDLILRDYQLEGVNWLIHAWCRENSVILADEMGLGKTIQTIAFISYLMNSCQLYGPFLLVVPLSTIVTWQREFELWAPDVNVVVYMGDLSSRNTIRQYEWCHPGNKRLKFNVIITTYEILLKDKSFLGTVSWAVLGIDEAHRLKNDDSLLYKSLVEFDTNHRILITGTPLQNSLKELWSLLHFIMPNKFDDWSEFESGNKQSEKTGFSGLHKQLEPYLLRRVKKDVEKSLPSKTEQILRVELSSLQKQYYRWILAKNYKALNKGIKGSVSSFINIIMELKKACNHAFLVRPAEAEGDDIRTLEALVKGSGKLILLDKLLLRLKETGHRVLIFSQMVRMLDILAEYMNLRHFLYQRLDGSIRGDSRKKAMDHFNAEGSTDFCFLLSTRAGGLGLNLASADTVIIFDSDWNPQNDLQAQARAHRIGQKNQVSVYRLVSKYSVEEDIIERAKRKMVLDHLVIQRMDTTGRTVLNRAGLQGPSNSSNTPFNKDELSSILKFGAEDLFKEDENEDSDLQVNLDDILQRAETRETDDHVTAGDELLSQFKVVSFDNMESEEIEANKGTDPEKDWESIIPEETRKKIDDEEMQQHFLEMNLPPRSRKTVKQFDIYDTDDETGKPKKVKEEETDSSEYSSDDGKPRKRGRPPAKTKEKVKGFNDAEIRHFIKSYRKFGNPWDRLEPIAFDAELQEKSQADLEKLVQLLKDGCENAMKEYEEKLKEDPMFDGKKTHRGPSFKIAGVTVNAKSVTNSMNDLSPLALCLPSNKTERKNYKIGVYVKPVHWDCDWNSNDDSRLLQGIYEHGMGNWEAIKMDPELQLGDKILPDGDTTKPQAKHLQTRADFLLKVLRRNIDGPKIKPDKPPKSKSGGGRKAKKGVVPKSQEIINDPMDDDSSDNQAEKENSEHKKKTPPGSPKKRDRKKDGQHDGGEHKEKKKRDRKKKLEKKSSQDIENMEDGEIDDDHISEEKPKKKKKKKERDKDGPMHFTANHEPVAVGHEGDFDTDLEQEVFCECKDKMRPVKKVLKKLDNPEPGLSDKDRVQHFTACLLRIGDRISECLSEYNDLEKIKEWRSNLWVFVSKFTEFDAKKLHKWFKHAVHKRKGDPDEKREKKKHKVHKDHGSNDISKRKQEEVKVKERDKDPNRTKKVSISSDEASRDSFPSNRDTNRHSGQPSFHNMHSVSRESSLSTSSPASFQHASPLAYRDGTSSSSYGQKPGGYGAYGRPQGSFERNDRGFASVERQERSHPHGAAGDHPRHNNDMFRGGGGGYGYHRPDYRGDHNRDPRIDHNRDPRIDHNRDPRGEHRKHYQRSETGNHAPRPPDDRWDDRSHHFGERKRRTEDGYSRDGRQAKEAKYHADQGRDQGRYQDSYH